MTTTEQRSMDEVVITLPECSSDEVSNLLRALTRSLYRVKPDGIHHGFLGGAWGYGVEFENETFRMFPYYWGDCTCGWEQKSDRWSDENKHTETCYQTAYTLLQAQHPDRWGNDKDGFNWAAKALCERYGIDWNKGYGSAVHCTCGHQKNWEQWVKENPHPETCPTVLPNFLHKPSGAKVEWYKYIGRSMEIDAPEDFDWRRCIRECIKSARPADSAGEKHDDRT